MSGTKVQGAEGGAEEAMESCGRGRRQANPLTLPISRLPPASSPPGSSQTSPAPTRPGLSQPHLAYQIFSPSGTSQPRPAGCSAGRNVHRSRAQELETVFFFFLCSCLYFNFSRRLSACSPEEAVTFF